MAARVPLLALPPKPRLARRPDRVRPRGRRPRQPRGWAGVGHVADTALGRIRTLRLSAFASIVVALALRALCGAGLSFGAAVLWSAWAPVVSIGDALAVVRLGRARRVRTDTAVEQHRLRGRDRADRRGARGRRPVVILPLFACAAGALVAWSLAAPVDRPEHVAESRLGAVGDVFRSAPRLVPLLGALLVGVGWAAAWQFLPLRIVGSGGGAFLVGVAGGSARSWRCR